MNIRTRAAAGFVSLVSLMALLTVLFAGPVSAAPPSPPPGLSRAIAAQEAHTDVLLAKPGVVGTAVGLAADGQPVVKVYTKAAGVRGLPAHLDGVGVEVEVTGELVAQGVAEGIGGSSGTERLIVYRQSIYCTVGTLGALVKDGKGVVYALSNAHVYANEGSKTYGAPVATGENGDRILQPGRVDMQPACGTSPQIEDAAIGRLWKYRAIVFSRTANNQIDAAIAKVSGQVDNATPPDGYGTPNATVAAAVIGQTVQKYGRTTGLTEGTVTGINATVLIKYDKGQARFVGQVVMKGSAGAFSAGGDSGSLIVTSPDNHPVALLFAGSSLSTIGNPIQAVLDEWGLSIVATP